MALFLFDLDGVVYLGNRPIPEAPPAIRSLIKRGHQVYFVTNNTLSLRREYVQKLKTLGLSCTADQMVTASYATALFLKRRFLPRTKVLVIGERGIREEIKAQGFPVMDGARCSWSQARKCRVLAVALDQRFSYKILSLGQRVLSNPKVFFVAANVDSSWPTEQGIMPGSGSLVAALSAASQRPPQAVIGKPEKFIFMEIMKIAAAKRSETFVIGDRLEVDILAGNQLGATTILVLTGVCTSGQAKKAKALFKPKVILKDLKGLIPYLKKREVY